MVSLSSSKADSVSNLTAARRNRLRRALLETLEQRCLMAADLDLLSGSELRSQTPSDSSPSKQLQFIQANLNEAALTDAASFLSSTLGSASGSLTSQPWFPLVNRAYDQWSQQNGLAFTLSTAQPEIMNGLAAEGEGLVAEGEAGGPRLLSVAPNSGEIFSFNSINTLTQAPTELVFRFDHAISASTMQSGIRITRSGRDGVFGNGNDQVVTGTAVVGDSPLIVTVRFPTTLVDDTYRIEVLGENNAGAIRDTGNKTLAPRLANTTKDSVDFKLELGAQVVAVVPQPVDRNADGSLAPQLDTIRVYFNNDDLDLASAKNPNFYQLVYTGESVQPNDDQRFTPDSVDYDPALDMATLKFAVAGSPVRIDQLAGPGTYRLRVGSNVVVNSVTNLPAISVLNPTDPSGYFGSAQSLDAQLATGSVRINQDLVNANNPLPLDFIGSDLDPGTRDINPTQQGKADNHIGNGADGSALIAKRTFSFSLNIPYGNDALGRPVYTSITPDQQARVREVFELYSQQLGIDFAEVEGSGADYNVVVGDMWPNGVASRPGGEAGIAGGSLAIMDGAETWDNSFGGGFFQVAMHEIGHLLGLGHSYDLPPGTTMGSYSGTTNDGDTTAVLTSSSQQYPGNNDVIHGQFIYRPDNKDVDLYKFTVGAGQTKNLRAETIAERLANSSDADTVITLYKQTASGLVVLASNNDYFSSDSFLTMDLDGGASGTTYFLAVTTAGNQDFDPGVSGSGSGGVSSGRYQLLVDLVDKTNVSIVDTSGTALDGDGDGVAGGDFNFWFRAAAPAGVAAPGAARTVFVDKGYVGVSDGSAARPYNSLPTAVANVVSGDILRIVGNLGADGLLNTVADTQAFEIGRGGPGNAVLSDGLAFQVPQGVTAMIDAGAVFKLRGSRITVGSLDTGNNNSFSSIQVLGTPAQPVYFTSYDDQSTGVDTNPIGTSPQAGDWSGIEIHNDVDRAQGRGDYERKGIFLNYIAHADLRYGGGQVTVATPSPTINPIYLAESRPTLLYNRITASADAAISADPDSFEETLFTEPRYQVPHFAGDPGYRPDYDRVGPDIRGNTLLNNSVNGLFIRVPTAPGQELTSLNVAARFDDTDIVYVLGENLIVGGTPGGALVENAAPNVSLMQATPGAGGTLSAGVYSYKVTFVDRFGAESIPSSAVSLTVTPGNTALQLNNLPAATGTFVARRIWRKALGDPAYTLVAEIDRSGSSYRDVGANLGVYGGSLNTTQLQRARRDARLAIDPGIVVKSLGSRIEASMGAQIIAEGTAERPIIFTSKLDDRYGAGGTFDTNNDSTATTPRPGDWGGLVARHLASMSLDHALIAYGGGVTSVPGGFAGFNALEFHQAEGRVAHSTIEQNSSGVGGNLQATRGGRGSNAAGVIFVDSSQPVIIDNVIRNNDGAAVNIDADSMKADSLRDGGRQTGAIDVRPGGLGNYGPLVRGNRLAGNRVNGMEVRGGTLTTETVWDDTDIVHVLRDEIYVPNFHHVGGMRLVSHVDESLVVKLEGTSAGITAGGRALDITDRIGGSVQIEGAPGFPVVMTSLKDDSVGAGFDPTGLPQLDTNGNGSANAPQPGDWRSIKFDALSNDRNVATAPELESDQIQDRGTNDDPVSAQSVGALATRLGYGDENLRLGFTINGAIASPQDLDVYSFVGTAGTQVWLDIDRTGASLDSVVELINQAGVVIAQSDNSLAESSAVAADLPSSLYQSSDTALIAPEQAQVLDKDPLAVRNSWNTSTARDLNSINPLDAGFRVYLPGTAGTTNTYYVRVRSSNRSPSDPQSKLQDPAYAQAGLTTGAYRLQIRLQQNDEVAGSSIHYADVRYATNSVEALATPVHSPLLGDNATPQGTAALNLGDLGRTDRGALTVAGQLNSGADVRWYEFSVKRNDVQLIPPAGGSLPYSPTHVSTIFDIDYADGYGGPNTNIWVYSKSTGRLVYMGTDSNVADDRAAPGQGSDVDDLTRGSAGSHDAFIGAQALPVGDYLVAVSNNSQLSAAMAQFQLRAGSFNGLDATATRLEPIESVQRIAEDRFEGGGPLNPSTAAGPIQVAFNNSQSGLVSDNQVPYTLADVVTYVITGNGTQTRLQNINAFTGALEEEISDSSTQAFLRDIAMSPDGRLMGYHVPQGSGTNAVTDGNSGGFYQLNTVSNGAATSAGSSGLQTFTVQQTNTTGTPTYALQQRSQTNANPNNPVGDGIQFNGLTYWTNNDRTNASLVLIGVGSRGNGQKQFNQPVTDANGNVVGINQQVNYNATNIVYSLDPNSGAALNAKNTQPRTGNNRTSGAGTVQREMGRFLSGTAASRYTDGTVTGLAKIGDILYAVSNRGELFVVDVGDGTEEFGSRANVSADPANETYYGVLPFTVLKDNNTPIVFTGLTAGPTNLKDGAGRSLSNVLFATTADGTIYAFNTDGTPANIFPGGINKTHSAARSVGSDIAGIAFSPLDVNLWHITDTRGGEAGHGYPVTYDRSRPVPELNALDKHSLYFGFENAGTTSAQQDGTWTNRQNVYNSTVNLPGGAKGAVESKPVDLSGYSADDLPMLYFNYFLSTENRNARDASDANFMRDSFRVYATTDGSSWTLLATNNSDNRSRTAPQDFRDGEDEYDHTSASNYVDAFGNPLMVQELYDAGDAGAANSWRQARINLSPFAGQPNVRLRFEFATGATFNTGDQLTGGVELSAVPGWKLTDGQSFFVSSTDLTPAVFRRFEFDLGLVLNLPGGASIPNGSTLQLNNRTYTFSNTPGVDRFLISATDSPEQVAQKVLTRLQADGYLVYANAVRPNVLILPTNTTNVPSTSTGAVYQTTGISQFDVIQGRPGVQAGSQSIPVRADIANYDDAAQAVRDNIRDALATALSNNETNVWTTYGQTIRLLKYDVTNLTAPLGLTTSRYGDRFGVNNTAAGTGVGAGVAERAQANTGAGVFVDDIIIGFAERGEQVINAPDTGITANNATFFANQDYEPRGFNFDENEEGRFQLEIRTGYDYGISYKHDSPQIPPPSDYLLQYSFDTNYRGATSIGLQVPPAAMIPDGTKFTLSDESNIATFEFDVTAGFNDNQARGTQPGNIPISITSNMTAFEVARAVRNAINSPAARTLLSLSASLNGEMVSGSTDVAAANSAIVLLHGNASISRTGGGLPAGSPLSLLPFGQDYAGREDKGDRNRGRDDQGQLVISSSSFSFASQWGVKLDDTSNPTSPRNLPTPNPSGLAPGAVLINNIFNSNNLGGVIITGDIADGARPVVDASVGRIINNTFYGKKSGDAGVRAVNGATPTLLNNIFSNLATAVSVDAASASTVVGANLFKDNSSNGVSGSFPIQLATSDPLFVSPAARNFYLSAGSQAIDSSLEALGERLGLSQVRNAIGLPPSPMLAPDRDIFGQRRVDDPTVSTPAGLGSNVFKDRGATDRSDFAALQAVILQPQDNDSTGVDVDRNIGFIRLNDGLVDYFSILLQDGEGIGPDSSTVTPDAIALTENGRLLLPGVDYVFGYNANSRTVRLTPLAGIWRSDSVYEISVNNRDGRRVTLGAGANVSNGDTITVTMPDNTTRVFTFSDSANTPMNIPFSKSDSPYELAVRFVQRINALGGGVSAYLQGSGAVMVVGAANVQSSKPTSASITSIAAVRDLAGNAVAPNRANSLTQFTIVMPGVQLDYGDAPGAGSFTLQANNGARHALLPIDVPTLALGQLADADPDGAPSSAATGDDNDASVDLGTLGTGAGVTLGSGGPASFIAPAGSAANVDGLTLTVTDTVQKTVVFELSTDGVTSSGNLPVLISISDTASQVATKLAAVVNAAVISGKITGLAGVASGSQVSLGGTAQHKFDVSLPSVLQRLSTGNVNLVMPANAATTVVDGQTFTITDGRGQALTFEINDVSLPGPVTPVLAPNVPVNIVLASATANTIAQAIADAINTQVAARRLSVGFVVASGKTVSIPTNDEDGVTFNGLFNGKANPVPVTVTATGTGMLDAWFDWNGDGDFNDAGEQVLVNTPVTAGANQFSIQTPASATVGFTAARFRLSTLGSLLPSGVGIGGEVEDYLIEVVAGTPPVGVAYSYQVNEDGVLSVTAASGILQNDTDAENDPLTVLDLDPFTPDVQTLASTTHGTLVLKTDGSFTYTPEADYFGTDTFVYQPMDLRLASNQPVTVTITVNPVNDPPKAFDDTITILEDQAIVRPGSDFWSNDWKHNLNVANEAGQSLSLVGATMLTAGGGTVSVGVDGSLSYTPPANYTNAINGPVLVLLTVQDGGVAGGDANPLTATSTLTINITPVNDRPEFTMPGTTSTVEDAGLVTTPFITAIRPGPANATDEASGPALTPENQTVSFQVRAIDPSLFAVQPAIAPDGTLTYQLAPNVNEIVANGSVPGFPPILVEVIAVDSGASTVPSQNSSLPVTFTILPAPINDAPEFFFKDQNPNDAVPANQVVTVTEDAGVVTVPAFLKNYRPGPASALDEQIQTLANINIQLLNAPAAPVPAFAVFPTIDPATFDLKFQSATDVNSHFVTGDFVFSVTLTDSGSGTSPNVNSTTKTFTISITPQNDRPEFTMPATTATVEDAGLVTTPFITNIRPGSVGAVDEATGPSVVTENQTVSFQVRALNPALFTVQPTIAPDGTLNYQLAPDVNQILANAPTPGFPPILVEVIAVDTGASAAPELNSSVPVTFTILPAAINDAPQFTIPTTATALEDAGLVTIPGFMTNFRTGPTTALDETNQTLSVTIGASAGTFTTIPSINLANGNLTFQTGPDVNSLTGHDLVVTVTLTDSGSGVAPNVNSTTKTFTLSITPVNDEPLFTLPNSSVTVFEDNEAVIGASKTQIANFATGIAVGPTTAVDELATQKPTFQTVSVSDPTLFSVQPTLTPAGVLEFVTATDKNGQAVVVVRLTDDGAATAPDDNVSPQQTFTIVVKPVNDAPEITVPATTPASREDQGLVVVPGFATGLRPGTVTATDEAGQTFRVQADPLDATAFSVLPTIAADGTLRYQAKPDVNSAFRDLRVVVTVFDDGVTGPLPDTNQSIAHTFTISITPVNDAPDFTLAQSTVTVIEDTEAAQVPPVAQTVIPGFATNITTGPATAGDEATQTVSFEILTVSAPELFSTQPSIAPDGTLSFKTAENKNGKAVVVVRMLDSGSFVAPNDNDTDLKTFTISVTPINDAPLFDVPAGLTVDEDGGVITQSGFATNVRRGPVGTDDESSQTIAFHVTAVHPEAFEIQPSIAPDGTLTFKTAANVNSANSDLTVRVYLTDNGLNAPPPNTNTSIEKTFSLTVNPVNDAPVADGLSLDSIEDLQITIQASTILAGDSAGPTVDEASQSLSITQVERTTRLGGTVTPVFSGSVITSLVYRPAENAVGVDTFLYVATDDGVPPRSGTGTISIALGGLNDPPQFTVGVDQTVLEDAGTVSVPNWATNILAGPPSAIDEPFSQTVSFVVTANNPALFEVQPTVGSDGTLSFKPAKDAVGTAVISLYAQDTGSSVAPNVNRSAVSSFSITMTPVNDAPVFTVGGAVSVNEDSGPYSQPWATGIAPAGGLLSVPPTATDEGSQVIDFVVTPDKPQLFAVAPTIDAGGVLRFTPAQNAFGVTLVTVVAKDRGPAGANDQNTSVAQTLTITINAQNDAPSALSDTLSANENDVLSVPAPGLLANDTDVDMPADQISVVAGTVTSALGATVTINADGSVVYDPRGVAAIQRLGSGQSQVDTFTYKVRDLAGATSSEATVTVNIQGVDDAPVAKNDIFTVAVGQTVSLDVLKNDTDDDSPIDFRTIQITGLPAFGTVSVNQTGVVSYTPGVGFRGSDSFSYVVRDIGGNVSNEATVTLTVNNAPRASDDNAFTVKNHSVVIDVTANDVDPDGTIDPSTVEIVLPPAPSGTATVGADGKIEYTPAPGFYGTVQLSYFVRDDIGSPSNVANVTVEVLRSAWQNPTLNLDVNGDTHVTPIDALLIINYLNTGGPSELPSNLTAPPYLDPSGDEQASPLDVLLIINYLNTHPSGEGESTAEGELGAPMIVSMVTPEQMVATVGPQIVREVESALASELELSQPWQSDDSSQLVTGLASGAWDEDDSLASLADLGFGRDQARDTDEVDSYFGSL